MHLPGVAALLLLLPAALCLEGTLSRCCTLGVQWSWNNRTCGEYPTPVDGVGPGQQAPCLTTLDACCRKNYRDRQCGAGLQEAKTGEACAEGEGIGASSRKDCCEGCKLGLIAGAMGLICEFTALKHTLGHPWDRAMNKCCLQAGGRASAGPSSWPPSTSTTPRPTTERQDLCALFPGQLCSQICITEGNSFRCACQSGFRLLPDGKTCQGQQNNANSPEYNTCPDGFTYNPTTSVCDDINECLIGEGNIACFPYKRCENTIGSFICVEDEQARRTHGPSGHENCPPGYTGEGGDCLDIDECALNLDICVRETQYCINTPGGFDCQSKRDFTRYNCPAGYKFNNATLNCDDVNECAEALDSCDPRSEVCRNTAGAYECDVKCESGLRYDTQLRICQDVDECSEGTHECRIDKERCVNVPGSYQCHQLYNDEDSNCPPGFETNPSYNFLCQDRNECAAGIHTCAESEICVNEMGGYRCEPKVTTPGPDAGQLVETSGSKSSSDKSSWTRSGGNTLEGQKGIVDLQLILLQPVCQATGTMEQVAQNECEEEWSVCDRTQLCENTLGSFRCHCRAGYYRDPITASCQVNECQTGQHSCLQSQRCDNTPGSYTCIRITGCGTGYTLNARTGACEDDDECLFGTHDCDQLGPNYQCRNTLGSFKCERVHQKCPHGLTLAPSGDCKSPCFSGYEFNSRGECVDIDECEGRPCGNHQQCVNSAGSYSCLSKIICPGGFEPDPQGTRCVDKDECADGTHTCKGNQECLNRGGGYICRCPPGHDFTADSNCEDIDECTKFDGQVCGSNADCHNTIGSYRCICHEGFEHGLDNRTCTDINECETIRNLCEQNCINTWGSYKCSCGHGYQLGEDGRSCRDVDECAGEDSRLLCVGNCVNTHGSYKCTCPDGYTLGSDKRSCHDVDECQRPGSCRQDEHCLNTRGGFRCNRIQCPENYDRDGSQHESRCKKARNCGDSDPACTRDPLTISKNYISFTSNIRIPPVGYVDMFTMRGPSWAGAVMHFNLEVIGTRAPAGVSIAGRNHFLLRRPTQYQAVVALAKPIEGPQDVELKLKMEVFHRGQFAGSAVAEILIVVTAYEF